MRVQIFGQRFGVHILVGQPAHFNFIGQPFGGTGHFIAAAVIQRDGQMHPVVAAGEQFQIIHQRDQFIIQLDPVPDEPHPHAFVKQRARLALDIAAEQPHQARYLGLGAFPVFGRKGEYCQIFDGKIRASLDDFTHPFGPGMMAQQSGPAAHLRPAAIAIHDDRDVIGPGPGGRQGFVTRHPRLPYCCRVRPALSLLAYYQVSDRRCGCICRSFPAPRLPRTSRHLRPTRRLWPF